MTRRELLLAAVALLAVTTFVMAQSGNQATLRTPSGDHPVTMVQQSGQTYVSAEEMVAGLGGTIQPDSTGFKVVLGKAVSAFGPDSRFGVIRDELIEMPVPPITVEGKPFVPWQFFQGVLTKATELDMSFDSPARLFSVRPRGLTALGAQVSVTNLQGISKIVITLTAPAEYSIVRDPAAYTLKFRAPLQAPFTEQAYEDPAVARVAFRASEMNVALTGPDIVGDPYQLENPFRIVLDLRKGTAPVPGAEVPGPAVRPSQPAGIRTIVIDPGHGGRDVGAIGPNGLMEKDVTMAMARKLASALGSRVGARVILTREDDSVVSLDQRTALANQYQADLFLSVHVNAAVVKNTKGSETYFLSLEASDEVARKAAETENAVPGQSSANADLQLVLWDLAQQEYLQESSRFAQVIQEGMNAATGVQNRGVKQAPFKVLVGATMPAALVEVGFITNPEEETRLASQEFQDKMVDTLVKAVARYKVEFETRIGLVQPAKPAPLAGGVPPATTAAPPQPRPRTGT